MPAVKDYTIEDLQSDVAEIIALADERRELLDRADEALSFAQKDLYNEIAGMIEETEAAIIEILARISVGNQGLTFGDPMRFWFSWPLLANYIYRRSLSGWYRSEGSRLASFFALTWTEFYLTAGRN